MRTPRPSRLRRLALAAALLVVTGACSDDGETDAGADADAGAGGGAAQTSDTSAAAPGPVAAESLDLVGDGKLTACTDPPNAPFEFLDQNGQLDGIDIELVRALAGRLGLTGEYEQMKGEELFRALDAGRCDIVASAVVITEERMQSVELSDRYFEVSQSLLVRQGDESRYDELATLAGRTIGVQAGTTGASFARDNAGGATIREFPGTDALFAALEGGQVDAVLHDYPVNTHRARTTGGTVVSKKYTEGPKTEYGLAMRKGQTALKAAIDDALAQVKSDETYPTILRRLLGDTAGQI